MSTSRTTNPAASGATESAQEKPGFRTKTIATRVTPEELREVEAAAERSGQTLAEWLRELSLKAARERPADPTELVLSEVAALRYMLLNRLFFMLRPPVQFTRELQIQMDEIKGAGHHQDAEARQSPKTRTP